MKKKVMKLVDPLTGKMVCKVCGEIHWASLRFGGRYYRGSWQCQYGCTLESPATIIEDEMGQIQSIDSPEEMFPISENFFIKLMKRVGLFNVQANR